MSKNFGYGSVMRETIIWRVVKGSAGCKVHMKGGEVRARLSGRLRQDGLYPAVGDWVAVSRDDSGTYTVHDILPRKSKISRKDAGRVTGEQVIATNVDVAFIMTSLNRDLNLRRLERYLAITGQSNVESVIILNKSDICDDVELHNTFPDIEELAAQCKFSDCQHDTEPVCAVKRALKEGKLSEVRLESYRKLKREMLAVERKKNPALLAEERKKWRNVGHLADEIRKRKESGS